jgi:general secretion pathway protein K
MTTSKKRNSSRSPRQRGGALLAVLWLSAALSAIAYSLANTVRGEVERTSTDVDGLRSYYLARAGIERGILYMQWGNGAPPSAPFKYKRGMPLLPFTFPSGQAMVEIIPETAKLNINTSPPLELFRLLLALGADPARAEQIVAAIVDWRSHAGITQFDMFYQSLTPSFRSRHASFEETEELLLLRGMTRELYYGGYYHDTNGHLVPRAGLRDCVSVFGSRGPFDVNTAEPAVLVTLGLPPEAAAAIVARRRVQPFASPGEVGDLVGGSPALPRLRVGGNFIFTLRSTARITLPNGQLSDMRRTVATTVIFRPDEDIKLQTLRWYDNAWIP